MKRIAKISATALLAVALVGCGPKAAALKDGTYNGEAKGFDEANPIKVEVKVAEGKIAEIAVLAHGESVTEVPETQEALDKLPAAIVEKGSTEVDGIAGATMTSDGIKAAVNNALEQAK